MSFYLALSGIPCFKLIYSYFIYIVKKDSMPFINLDHAFKFAKAKISSSHYILNTDPYDEYKIHVSK